MDLTEYSLNVEMAGNEQARLANSINYKEIELAYKRYITKINNPKISSDRLEQELLGFYNEIDKEIERLSLEKFKVILEKDNVNNKNLPKFYEKLQEYLEYSNKESRDVFKESLFNPPVERASESNVNFENMPFVPSAEDNQDIPPSEQQVLTGDQFPHEDAAY